MPPQVHTHMYTFPHVHTPRYTFPHVHTPMYTFPHVHTHMYMFPHVHTPTCPEGHQEKSRGVVGRPWAWNWTDWLLLLSLAVTVST